MGSTTSPPEPPPPASDPAPFALRTRRPAVPVGAVARAPARWACWVAGLTLLLASCISPPDAESLLAVGFRSPEQTFATFRTAVRGDLATLEYRCFSAGFRRANGLSAHSYVEARAELLRRNPFIRWVARAEITLAEPRGERGYYIEALVDAKLAKRRLGLTFVRDDAIEIYAGDPEHRGQLIFDDYVDFDDIVDVRRNETGDWELRARERFTPFDADADPERIGEVRFLQDWKIDDFEDLSAAEP